MSLVQEYALLNGTSVHASAVPRGLRCNCNCPACDSPMIAKQGLERTHHFAHLSGIQCEFGVETALHLEAKRILEKNRRINLPERPGDVSHADVRNGAYAGYKNVRLEHWFHDIIPDVVVDSDFGELLIEVFVTHRVGGEKAAMIEEKQLNTVEIDLRSVSREFEPTRLERRIIDEVGGKRWIFPVKMAVSDTSEVPPPEKQGDIFRPRFSVINALSPEKEAALYHGAPVTCRRCGRNTADWSSIDLKTMTCLCRTCCAPG